MAHSKCVYVVGVRTGVCEFAAVSMISEICKEDVLFLAKIRLLRSNLHSNNKIRK